MNLGIETEYIEFKTSTSQLPRAIETLAAMLNKHGKGEVCFGVLDDGEVCGLNLGNKTIKDISEQIAEKIKPTVIPTITVERYDDYNIIRVTVEGSNKPYSGNGHYLIRSGSENRKLEPDELKDLLFTNSVELIGNMESFNQDLKFDALKSLYIMKKIPFDDKTFEANLGLLTKDKKYNILAELLADNNDISIKVVRFAGTNKTNLVKRNEFGYKNLFLAMNQALEYTLSFNETKVELSGKAERDEQKLFDEESLREAWLNACLHNRWAKLIPPAIYIYDDRIEVVSTGGLPIDFSEEDFYIGISHPINKQLQKIMGQLGYVEQTGHGVPQIVEHYGKEAFRLSENSIVVTIKFAYEITQRTVITEGLNVSEKKVYELVKINPHISKNKLAEMLELSEPTISKCIRALKEYKLIERVGSNKTGYWKIL